MSQVLPAIILPGLLLMGPGLVVAQDSGLPPLVGLDEAPAKKELVIGAPHRIDKPRVAIMEPQLGAGVPAKTGRRFLKRLAKALESTKKVSPVLQPTNLRSVLPLEDQARLLGCGRRECVQALGQLIPLDLVLVVTLRQVEREPLAVIRGIAPDGVEHFVQRTVLPQGVLRPDKAVVLANQVLSALAKNKGQKKSAPASKPGPGTTVAKAGSQGPAAQPNGHPWLRSVGFGMGLGGVGLIGSSYATLSQAQDAFDARPITRETVDTLSAAEGRARVLWGAGLALGGLSVVSLALGR